MTPGLAVLWRGMASGSERGPAAQLLKTALCPVSLLFAGVQVIRAGLYRSGILKPKRLPRPVVSVGNITVGGTGKTPVTAWLAQNLIEQGFVVAVLSRGYGGALEGQVAIVSDGRRLYHDAASCGDEPCLLAATVPGLIVVIGSDRFAAGELAVEKFSPDIFILDDGFQHLRLFRDLNILLLDYKMPFGNSLTLPAGLLREPISAMGRADLCIVTRAPANAPSLPRPFGKPGTTACYRLHDLLPIAGGRGTSFRELAGMGCLAFAGIAEPSGFFDSLEGEGISLVQRIAFRDHAPYDSARVDEIMRLMAESKAAWAITTAKDAVKLHGLPADFRSRVLVARLGLDVADPECIQAPIRKLLQK